MEGTVKELEQPSLKIRRGLFAAGLAAIAGALIPAVLALGYVVFRRLNPDSAPANRFGYFLSDLAEYWIFPVCGGAVFFACAAWATFAPPGSWRFAWSLLIIALISVSSWFLVGRMDDWLHLHWLKIYKEQDPHTLRPSQALILFGTPAAMAQLLVTIRLWRTKQNATQLSVKE
jgi:hypothetical protein